MKKTVYFITGNKSKFSEARLIVKDIVNLKQKDSKLNETQAISQERVVIEKANEAYSRLKKPVLVDDTAIYFSAYKDFPGTYTKTLFGCLGFEGVEKLLNNRDRTAHFRTIICYKDRKSTKLFSGIWNGRIVRQISRRFNPDWQYNSIFIPDGYKKLLSEIPLEERAKYSHRKRAFDKLVRYLKTNNNGHKIAAKRK